MTSQQIQLKIEYYLKNADRGLLDKVPLPGGRMRLLAANPESYLCNYAMAEQWLDIDETIEAAEEEFAGRGVSPCRFYGAPDSLSLDMLRPAFARHGYAVKELRGVRMLALAGPVRQVRDDGYEYNWQSGPLDEEEQQFLRPTAGNWGLGHIRRQLRRGMGRLLFARREGKLAACLLVTQSGDTVMLSDFYSPLDWQNPPLAESMVSAAVDGAWKNQAALVFVQTGGQGPFALYRRMGFEPVEMPPVWWAVKGTLPVWLAREE